jgi:RNA polymerase sigma-70 factor (ECF subfamily)
VRDASPIDVAARRVELTVRTSYGRLVAYLAARWHDVTAAEDALSDALAAALRTWPEQGVPEKPESWLLAAAHRKLIDGVRHDRVRARLAADLADAVHANSSMSFPDHRLPLLFVCAHPAIAAEARAPLMLQTVLGLDAARIAAAFLVAPATMSQRLVRAKTKIREAGIAFRIPESSEFPARLEAVLDAIYASFGAGWDDAAGADPRTATLARDALALGRAIVESLPEAAEARGLLALMLHCEARRRARRDATGRYLPLSAQRPERWDAALAADAERELAAAARVGAAAPGRYQLEAAIQSVHAARAHTGRTDWAALRSLYAALVQLFPAVGARVSQAAVLLESDGAVAALAVLDALPAATIASYQPYWAVRAHALERGGHTEASAHARRIAIGLTVDPAVREFLRAGGTSNPRADQALPDAPDTGAR